MRYEVVRFDKSEVVVFSNKSDAIKYRDWLRAPITIRYDDRVDTFDGVRAEVIAR